jgi:glucose-1-phosphate thymidylyltransferase
MRQTGVKEVAIILGSIWPERVREFYGDGSSLVLKITYINQGEPRGLAHAVGLAKDFVKSDKFVVYLGDNLLRGGISSYAEKFAHSKSDAMVLLSKVSDPERFGVAKFDKNGKLEALIEKPKQAPSPYALVGVYFFSPAIFDEISQLKPSWRGELEITDAIQSLLVHGALVEHTIVEGWWKDTGTPEDILEANRLILDETVPQPSVHGTVAREAVLQGRIRIEEGAQVGRGVTIRGPVHVGKGTVVNKGSFLGPYTSIGENCVLEGCEIENSIVMDNCRIGARQRITDSLIGPECEILNNDDTNPKAWRFIIGEKSHVRI